MFALCETYLIAKLQARYVPRSRTRPTSVCRFRVCRSFAIRPGHGALGTLLKRVFQVFEGNMELCLTYGAVPGGEKLQGYADCDGSMAEDRHAISRYAFMLCAKLVCAVRGRSHFRYVTQVLYIVKGTNKHKVETM